MFTEFQQKNFKKNILAKIALERLARKMSEYRNYEYVVDFYNMMEELKIDIISTIPDEMCERLSPIWIESIILEILHMEIGEIEKMFFSETSIDFNEDLEELIKFIMQLHYYTDIPNIKILRLYQYLLNFEN